MARYLSGDDPLLAIRGRSPQPPLVSASPALYDFHADVVCNQALPGIACPRGRAVALSHGKAVTIASRESRA